MSENGDKPRRAPGGKAADPKTVDLYRLLYEAKGPLTLDEIAASSLLAVYKTPAYVAYRDHLARQEQRLEEGWVLPNGTLPATVRRTAWLWWVGKLVSMSARDKRIITSARDGSAVNGKGRDQLVYTANRDRPPVVSQVVMVERNAYWSPGFGQLGERHAAGMQFLQQAEELLKRPKYLAADAKEIKEALALAVKAIREGEAS